MAGNLVACRRSTKPISTIFDSFGPTRGARPLSTRGRVAIPGVPDDVLAVTPPRGSELDLWIDPRTHLIARVTATVGIVSSETLYSNYRRVDGVLYPFLTSTRLSTGNAYSERVTSLELNADVAERMRVPGQNVRDSSISGASSTAIPIEIVNNHIYLTDVMLDNHGPYRFVLDSGGDYIVTPEVAAALQAKSSGAMQLQGVGNATEGAAFAHIGSLAVGRAIVRNQYTLVLPISTGFGVAEGLKIDGMLGYQFLARFLTTIDYANSTLTLAMPSGPPGFGARRCGDCLLYRPYDPADPHHRQRRHDFCRGRYREPRRPRARVAVPRGPSRDRVACKDAAGRRGIRRRRTGLARLGRVPAVQIGPYALSQRRDLVHVSKSRGIRRSLQSRQYRRRDLAPIRP